VRELRSLRPLTVVVCSSDEGFARAVGEVCARRGHDVYRLESLGALMFALGSSSPSVLLYDAGAEPVEGLLAASRVSTLHPDLPIVVAGRGLRLRSQGCLRLVDRRTSAEAVVDEVELAHIGIPAFVEEPLRQVAPADLVGTR
jgi:hypothetical protein